MKKVNWFLVSLVCMFFASFAYAADAAVPGFGQALADLLSAVTSKAPFAVVLVAVLQFLRTKELLPLISKLAGRYLQLYLAGVTAVGYVVAAVVRGSSWGAAAVEGLFTFGGASLIYDQIRALKS